MEMQEQDVRGMSDPDTASCSGWLLCTYTEAEKSANDTVSITLFEYDLDLIKFYPCNLDG